MLEIVSQANARGTHMEDEFKANGGHDVLHELLRLAGYESGRWQYRIKNKVPGSAHDAPAKVEGVDMWKAVQIKVRPPRGDNGSRVLLGLVPPDGIGTADKIRGHLEAGARLLKSGLKQRPPLELTDDVKRKIIESVKEVSSGPIRSSMQDFADAAYNHLERAGVTATPQEFQDALKRLRDDGLLLQRDRYFAPTELGNQFFFGWADEPAKEAPAAPPMAATVAAPAPPPVAYRPAAPEEPRAATLTAGEQKASEAAPDVQEEALSLFDALERASALKRRLESLRGQMGPAGAAVGAAEKKLAELQATQNGARGALATRHLRAREELLHEQRRQLDELDFTNDLELEEFDKRSKEDAEGLEQAVAAARSDLEELKSYADELAKQLKNQLALVKL